MFLCAPVLCCLRYVSRGDPAWVCEDKETSRGMTLVAVAFPPVLTVEELGQ